MVNRTSITTEKVRGQVIRAIDSKSNCNDSILLTWIALSQQFLFPFANEVIAVHQESS